MSDVKEQVIISVDPGALEGVRANVASGRAVDLSAAVEEALIAQQRSEALREALELWEEEHGPISREAEEWARREISRVSRERLSSTPAR